MLGTVDKAGRVLALFTSTKSDWGVTEVARTLGMPKSSAHSLLTALAATGLLGRTDDNRYRLGWRVLSLSRTLLDSSEVLLHARPAIRTLAQRFGVTVHVATLDDAEVTYLDKVEGGRGVPIPLSGVGRRLPAHCTALGKTLLAYESLGMVEQLVATRGLPQLTARTITSIDALSAELDEVRKRGWACADEEVVEGVCCYAAPIFNRDMRVAAAISVSVPVAEDRAHPDRYVRLAMGAATYATRKLRTGAEWVAESAGDAGGAAPVAAAV
ncbi:MAG: IclR family transcriptional regulator [Conexibacter sp.]|nr:IclR family transcriptional regulator [Conexibacter sp.]